MYSLGADCPIFTWGQDSYKMIPGSTVNRKSLGDGGFSLSADLKFHCLTAQFLSEDVTDATGVKDALEQQKIVYLGDQFKIQAVTIAPGGFQLMVEANALNQGA